MADKAVGKVAHYYDKICVAVVDVTGQLKVGDTIKIDGNRSREGQRGKERTIGRTEGG